MKKLLASAVLALAISGCAVMQQITGSSPSPEAGIAAVANSVGAASALGEALLKNKKITKAQAISYDVILRSASAHLHVANTDLLACRKNTASTQATSPDPCKGSIMDDIALAASVAGDVKKAMDAK